MLLERRDQSPALFVDDVYRSVLECEWSLKLLAVDGANREFERVILRWSSGLVRIAPSSVERQHCSQWVSESTSKDNRSVQLVDVDPLVRNARLIRTRMWREDK